MMQSWIRRNSAPQRNYVTKGQENNDKKQTEGVKRGKAFQKRWHLNSDCTVASTLQVRGLCEKGLDAEGTMVCLRS